MSRSIRTLTERQILKARAEGKLDNLAGEGKPLPDRPEGALADRAVLTGVRIMAEAGALPEEFTIKKEIKKIKDMLTEATDPEQRKQIMARLANAEMRLGIAQEARRKFLR